MTAFVAFASLFRYPDEAYADRARVAQAVLSVPDPRTGVSAAHEDLEAFVAAMSRLDLPAQQATYTSTFDLAPSCSPYLGIHLFGEENPERARLMLGLRSSYERVGFPADNSELPDHVAEVMAFAAQEKAEEHDDLVRLVLVPALEKMDALLRPTSNPYRHLVSAALHLGGGEL
ncbi:MAG TPA: nitrate reductase molybdenum cofactor assembly chaperone [Thermoanaerobaculia bacterium]|nr:nitrate reductase molybdenum cofactor assembly chaperone [Thermoanaerobaculia bacterium]